MQSAVIAVDAVLKQFKAKNESDLEQSSINVNGWKIQSKHDKICTSNDLITLARKIEATFDTVESSTTIKDNTSNNIKADDDNININGYSMRLPPMLFLHDWIEIIHLPSKTTLSFRADDSLIPWAEQHTASFQVRLL